VNAARADNDQEAITILAIDNVGAVLTGRSNSLLCLGRQGDLGDKQSRLDERLDVVEADIVSFELVRPGEWMGRHGSGSVQVQEAKDGIRSLFDSKVGKVETKLRTGVVPVDYLWLPFNTLLYDGQRAQLDLVIATSFLFFVWQCIYPSYSGANSLRRLPPQWVLST
jgi:hypothetical protein